MKKILLTICIVIIWLISHPLYTAANSGNLNSQNFMVNIWAMDPLWWSHQSDPSVRGTAAFGKFIGKVTDIILVMIPILAWVSMLIAGYFYIFSAWDSEKAWRAKTIIKWNIIAIFVSILSYAIVKTVASFFS